MKVLMGSCLALLLAGSAPALAGDNGAPQGYEDTGSTAQDAGSQAGAQMPAQSARHQDRHQARHDQRRAERRAARHNQQQTAQGASQGQENGQRHHARHGDHAGKQAGQRGRSFAQGDQVPQRLLNGKRVVTNYQHFRVQAPQGGDRWVKSRSQLLLVSADGRVKMAMERHRRAGGGQHHARRADRQQQQDNAQDQSYP